MAVINREALHWSEMAERFRAPEVCDSSRVHFRSEMLAFLTPAVAPVPKFSSFEASRSRLSCANICAGRLRVKVSKTQGVRGTNAS